MNFLNKNKKIVKNFQMTIVIFTGMKNHCMLHGRVFVMNCIFGTIMTVRSSDQPLIEGRIWFLDILRTNGQNLTKFGQILSIHSQDMELRRNCNINQGP